MEVLFHFVFELVKISILASIYAIIVLIAFKIIGHFKPDSWVKKVSNKKLRFWFVSGAIISVTLFVFMFTYWGNHGLGDNAILPVGHFKIVKNANGSNTYIEDSDDDQLGIIKFTYDKNNLYAEVDNEFSSYKGNYVVWDLHTNTYSFYQNGEYYRMMEENNYPKPNEFKDFRYFYKKHWHGWRFFLLP